MPANLPAPTLTQAPKKIKSTARTRKRLVDAPPVVLTITNLTHDGRGVAVYTDDSTSNPEKIGKKVFVSHALPHETVQVKITNSKKNIGRRRYLSRHCQSQR